MAKFNHFHVRPLQNSSSYHTYLWFFIFIYVKIIAWKLHNKLYINLKDKGIFQLFRDLDCIIISNKLCWTQLPFIFLYSFLLYSFQILCVAMKTPWITQLNKTSFCNLRTEQHQKFHYFTFCLLWSGAVSDVSPMRLCQQLRRLFLLCCLHLLIFKMLF